MRVPRSWTRELFNCTPLRIGNGSHNVLARWRQIVNSSARVFIPQLFSRKERNKSALSQFSMAKQIRTKETNDERVERGTDYGGRHNVGRK